MHLVLQANLHLLELQEEIRHHLHTRRLQRGRKERSGEEAVWGEDQMCCHARVSRARERAAASVAAAELKLVVAAMNHPGQLQPVQFQWLPIR